jgi:hypothetical protein
MLGATRYFFIQLAVEVRELLLPRRTRRTRRKDLNSEPRRHEDTKKHKEFLICLLRVLCAFAVRLNFRFSSGAADTALAKPSGAGGGTPAHSPQSADFVGNVSVRRSVSSVVQLFLTRSARSGPPGPFRRRGAGRGPCSGFRSIRSAGPSRRRCRRRPGRTACRLSAPRYGSRSPGPCRR